MRRRGGGRGRARRRGWRCRRRCLGRALLDGLSKLRGQRGELGAIHRPQEAAAAEARLQLARHARAIRQAEGAQRTRQAVRLVRRLLAQRPVQPPVCRGAGGALQHLHALEHGAARARPQLPNHGGHALARGWRGGLRGLWRDRFRRALDGYLRRRGG